MNKFCPKCGKSISDGIFCSDCNPSILEFKPVKVKLCPSGKYFFRGKWSEFNDLKAVTKIIVEKSFKEKVKIVQGLEFYEDLLEKTGLKKDFEVIVSINNEKFSISVNVEVTSSPVFSKVGSTYFEGILQLRNANDAVKRFVNELIIQEKDVYVNKVIDKSDSVDYYFVKKKFLGRVAEKIVFEFGGFMDLNAQLFSQDKQTSKELFRVNAVVHIPPFSRSDVVIKKDDLFIITSLGKHIGVFDLKKGKNFSFKYNPGELHEYNVLKKQKTKIINIYPEITALSNSSYEVVVLENPLGLVVDKNENVSIVEHNHHHYLVK